MISKFFCGTSSLLVLGCLAYWFLFALHMRNRFRFLVWDRLELACVESVKQTTG